MERNAWSHFSAEEHGTAIFGCLIEMLNALLRKDYVFSVFLQLSHLQQT